MNKKILILLILSLLMDASVHPHKTVSMVDWRFIHLHGCVGNEKKHKENWKKREKFKEEKKREELMKSERETEREREKHHFK